MRTRSSKRSVRQFGESRVVVAFQEHLISNSKVMVTVTQLGATLARQLDSTVVRCKVKDTLLACRLFFHFYFFTLLFVVPAGLACVRAGHRRSSDTDCTNITYSPGTHIPDIAIYFFSG
jgi:hypothetical protein